MEHSVTVNILRESQPHKKVAVIKPSESLWRIQVLITSSENLPPPHTKEAGNRLLANRFTLLDAYPLPRINEKGSEIAKYRVYSTLELRSAYHQVVIKSEDRPYTPFNVVSTSFDGYRSNGVASFHRIIDRIISIEKLEVTFAYIDNVTVYGLNHSNHNSMLKIYVCGKHNLSLNNDKCSFCVDSIKLLGYTVSKCSMTLDPEQLNHY